MFGNIFLINSPSGNVPSPHMILSIGESKWEKNNKILDIIWMENGILIVTLNVKKLYHTNAHTYSHIKVAN